MLGALCWGMLVFQVCGFNKCCYFLFRPLLRSGCSLLGMCFAMTLLYGTVLFVLECWFECNTWLGVAAAMGVQVCGLNTCSQFPL